VGVHRQIDRLSARELRRQVDVFDLLVRVPEMVAVNVEKGLKRRVEALSSKNLRHDDAILPVYLDLDVVPHIRRAVVDRDTVAFKPKRIDGWLARASEAQAQQDPARDEAPQPMVRNHGLS